MHFALILLVAWTHAQSTDSNSSTLPKGSNGMNYIFYQTNIQTEAPCEKNENWNNYCKFHKKENTNCKESTKLHKKIIATWEQHEKCKNYDYFARAGSIHLKNSGWVYNITTNWTTFFDNRARTILENGKGTFICQFAAKRYNQLRDPRFFHGVWQPSAIKCVNHLADVRRAMMCVTCDGDEASNIKVESLIKDEPKPEKSDDLRTSTITNIVYNFQTCTEFMSNCIDYLHSKQMFLDRLNVAFTLGLCDREGYYIAQGSSKSYYKKVLPSNVVYDEEDIEQCRRSLQKDITLSKEDVLKFEDSCLTLCHKHFSLSTMILDDITNLNNLKYIHDILKEIVSDNMNPNLFNTILMDPAEVALDFTMKTPKDFLKDQLFNFLFYNASNNNTKNTSINLEKYIKDNGFKIFDAALYVRAAFVLAVGIWFAAQLVLAA